MRCAFCVLCLTPNSRALPEPRPRGDRYGPRPKYIIGQAAAVIKVNRTRAVVRFNDSRAAGRFADQAVTAPLAKIARPYKRLGLVLHREVG